MGRKGYKRRVSGNRMRKFPGAGDVLLIRPSTGFTHPEEGKRLCKKRGKGMRIICNPGRSEQQALNFIFAGMNPVIFSPYAAAAVLLSPFSLWGGEATFMSYNVKNGTGMDGKRDYDRTARVIAEAKPDVAALQELDSVTGRMAGRFIPGELGEMTGMHARFCRAIDYDGGAYGVGLLSRDEPLAVRRIPLPGREESRVLFVAEFPDYVVCVTHLSLTPEDQRASLPIIRTVTDTCRKPVLLAGDFNMKVAKTVLDGLDGAFRPLSDTTQMTFPSGKPSIRIDYILGRGLPESAVVTERQVDTSTVASDHCPLWVSLAWKK